MLAVAMGGRWLGCCGCTDGGGDGRIVVGRWRWRVASRSCSGWWWRLLGGWVVVGRVLAVAVVCGWWWRAGGWPEVAREFSVIGIPQIPGVRASMISVILTK